LKEVKKEILFCSGDDAGFDRFLLYLSLNPVTPSIKLSDFFYMHVY